MQPAENETTGHDKKSQTKQTLITTVTQISMSMFKIKKKNKIKKSKRY